MQAEVLGYRPDGAPAEGHTAHRGQDVCQSIVVASDLRFGRLISWHDSANTKPSSWKRTRTPSRRLPDGSCISLLRSRTRKPPTCWWMMPPRSSKRQPSYCRFHRTTNEDIPQQRSYDVSPTSQRRSGCNESNREGSGRQASGLCSPDR